MLSDVEIANAAAWLPIAQIAEEKLGLDPALLVPYGHDKAKLPPAALAPLADRPEGRLVLVTAMSPTPAGEGKTTTLIGLHDGLRRIGVRSVAALREPSMGPVFGIKGGAAGGGYAQVIPMVDINLHFTGDFAALSAAVNLLAALIDNHVHHGNALDIDVRAISWKRALDVNDRALREVVVGLGAKANGVPREDGFDIVVASELMAIFCLATSLEDLQRRIGDIVVARTRTGALVRARDLDAEGALTVLLKDALAPNLVQTLEHNPVLVHGGPFANIAHGCNSVQATRAALRMGDVVLTEAGFGADLGAEKFFDLKCRLTGLRPDAAVVVATVRALKYHGGTRLPDLGREDLDAVRSGFANLARHLTNIRDIYGVPAVVAINRFPSDTDGEIDLVVKLAHDLGFAAHDATHVVDGGAGAEDLARGLMTLLEDEKPDFRFCYPDDATIEEKVRLVASRVYGASGVVFSARARRQVAELSDDGFGELPVCIAKTPMSFTTDPSVLGAPTGHTVEVRELRLSAGAGFVVVLTGDVMTMPGLPKVPASARIGLDADGQVVGLS
ncbi:MAG: formate--tetrahydrofolate ligase [Nocardioides sp.]|nr:formate--tetrahydrofolate ligase [Nocardioides sp.]